MTKNQLHFATKAQSYLNHVLDESNDINLEIIRSKVIKHLDDYLLDNHPSYEVDDFEIEEIPIGEGSLITISVSIVKCTSSPQPIHCF